MNSRALKRIEDVRMLRTHQFTEDASPMAHPIRPQSFMEINNFYTMTVYEKGAEVVRLYNTLLGVDGFRKGMDLYFKRHDGQAVTTEDFLGAMADANDTDLSQMQNWYDQAGTPIVDAEMEYDADAQTCTLTFKQSYAKQEKGKELKPVLIPIKLGLLNHKGEELLNETVQLTKAQQSFTFEPIVCEPNQKPLPSLLRDFSAPVKLNYAYSTEDFIFLMQHDTDNFNRWEASQRLAKSLMIEMLEQKEKGQALGVETQVIDAYQRLLENEELDHALRVEALTLPSETDLSEMLEQADPQAIHEVREFLAKSIAQGLRLPFENTYDELLKQEQGEYKIDPSSMGKRTLKNVCLNYLGKINDPGIQEQCYQQFSTAKNMTDTLSALAVLINIDCPQRQQALDDFEQKWQHDTLVMDKWFAMQASSSLPDTLDKVKALMDHKLWSIKNPNKVRSLIGAFAMGNPVNFHKEDGSGYQFHADFVLELDKLNPQVASRMVRALMNWRHYEAGRSQLMREQLKRIKAQDGLSGDVFEIVSKAL
jgi:aminopeptidase N